MDHGQALELQAAERYLLGELSTEEAAEFESHFFECTDCCVGVELGLDFVRHAKAVLAEPSPAPSRATHQPETRKSRIDWWSALTDVRAWLQPASYLPAAAAVLLASVVIYQSGVIIPGLHRALTEPQAPLQYSLGAISRGEAVKIDPPATTPITLAFDLPPDQNFSSYRCVIHRKSDGKEFVEKTAPPRAGEPVTVYLPSASVQNGDYVLSVYGVDAEGAPGPRISDYSFEVVGR
ncbi:MAG TPA: zf-HC2 domain-containing protein [Bryobacteraceae bacterium]|jgi:hypothetical protein|nr:zf-HC2 domain-containing protein [Bryobacteraceae bacterium]